MLKKIVLISILAIFISFQMYQTYLERQKQAAIIDKLANEIEALFDPIINNTSFTINDDHYFLKTDTVEFHGDPKDQNGIVLISYHIYENEDQLLANDHLPAPLITVYVGRPNKDSEYSLNRHEKSSYILQLYESFTAYFYDYHYLLHNEKNWSEKGSDSSWNEEEGVIDEWGFVQTSGKANYTTTTTANHQVMTFETEFMLKKSHEQLVIPIHVTYPASWNR
ncbi:hypothetical protein H1D32_11825 [Anaerobacillus sp. CMMVII]|uniref:hypothetical protein n=1 Tax=Anaerobacillus sp. CMMVII TaxID=2755588 RepID=UPI0021B75FE8|nr:hypothetical protein [Anaerobacillus sp. CMMVII]MCT8138379.1 hypothetical protein [Anaerobacillus sp. CMMVII]